MRYMPVGVPRQQIGKFEVTLTHLFAVGARRGVALFGCPAGIIKSVVVHIPNPRSFFGNR